jgi:hypothetical protein
MTFPERMTFDGDWRPALDFIARAYKDNSSVRSSIEGERNIQGFFTAYLSINAYYLTMPEVELNHGFCDMFLMPDLQRYPEVEHSYILENISRKTSSRHSRRNNVMQFCGWELARMEEV